MQENGDVGQRPKLRGGMVLAGAAALTLGVLAAAQTLPKTTTQPTGVVAVNGVARTPKRAVPTLFASTDPGDYQAALTMWRTNRAKSSCASCHGPDFFDLARIGTSDPELVRRAKLDGASDAEAQVLIRGVAYLRQTYGLAPENPRSFRPFQPGGAVLPGASNIERDLAFAGELARTMPTLTSATAIRSLADAKRARDEFLAVDFERLRIGIALPLWSADIAHGAQEGTFNDWIADVGRIAKPGREAEWLALQDAYLGDPSDLNFWKLYFAVDDMTQVATPLTPVDPADRWKPDRFTSAKFKSVLIGQHGLRTQALRRAGFMRGPVAFAYLGTEEPFKSAFKSKSATVANGERVPDFLPNPWWDVGDVARFGFRPTELSRSSAGNTGGADRMRDTAKLLGYPQFVQDSITPTTLRETMLDDTQLAWFMLGVRLDPSLRRIGQSNSILVGEYLQAQFAQQDYYIHRVFQTGLRTVMRAYQSDAMGPAFYNLHFGYFTGYGRHMLTRWNSAGEEKVSSDLKARQVEAYKRITANFFRMSLYLHEEELDRGRIKPYRDARQDGDYAGINAFFDYAKLPERNIDDALIRQVAAKSQTTLTF